jgi:hypothetical protein
MQTSGEHDPLIPFADQTAAMATARQVDGATGAGQPCGPGCTRYPSAGATPVVTIIHAGGHIYPPGLSARIVAFFKNQVRH